MGSEALNGDRSKLGDMTNNLRGNLNKMSQKVVRDGRANVEVEQRNVARVMDGLKKAAPGAVEEEATLSTFHPVAHAIMPIFAVVCFATVVVTMRARQRVEAAQPLLA